MNESQLRSHARTLGYALKKDRARSWSVHHQGGWMIIDAERNWLVAGENFDLNDAEVEAFITQP